VLKSAFKGKFSCQWRPLSISDPTHMCYTGTTRVCMQKCQCRKSHHIANRH